MNIGGRKITTRQYGGGSLITSTYFVIFVIVISFLIYIFYSNKR